MNETFRVISARQCERVPESEFDRCREEFLSDGWREESRKGGFVFIVRGHDRAVLEDLELRA